MVKKIRKHTITSGAALNEAAASLRVAYDLALRKEDVENLLNVTAAWIEISSKVTEREAMKKGHTVGFGIEHMEVEDE